MQTPTPELVGQRLRQARLAAGLTLEEVSQRLDRRPTKQALSLYEHGQRSPDAGSLRRLAAALGVPAASLLLSAEPVTVTWLAYRKQARLSRRTQLAIEAWATQQVDAYLKLDHLLSVCAPRPWLAPRPAGTRADAAAAADALRGDWALGTGPVPNLAPLAEDRGAIVLTRNDQHFDGLSGWTRDGRPVIVLQGNAPADRRRLSLAHEIGHLLLDCGEAPQSEQERLAFHFGSAFLVPDTTVLAELGARRARLSLSELTSLKRKYGLSMQAWLLRARDLGIITQRHYEEWQRRISANGWRGTEPVAYDSDGRPVRLAQMVGRALAEGLVRRSWVEACCPEQLVEFSTMEPEEPAARRQRRELRDAPRAVRAAALATAAGLARDDYLSDPELTALTSLDGEPVHVDAE